jgi:hypothetical protein
MKPLFQFLGPFGSAGNIDIDWRNAVIGSPASPPFASQFNPFAHSPHVCM